MRKIRLAVVLAVISFGVYKGGPFGALYAFIGFGVLMFVLYMVFDLFHVVASFMQPRTANYTTNNNLTIETARKGTPTEDEMGAILESARLQGRAARITKRT